MPAMKKAISPEAGRAALRALFKEDPRSVR
jgi:hypothetical protein